MAELAACDIALIDQSYANYREFVLDLSRDPDVREAMDVEGAAITAIRLSKTLLEQHSDHGVNLLSVAITLLATEVPMDWAAALATAQRWFVLTGKRWRVGGYRLLDGTWRYRLEHLEQ